MPTPLLPAITWPELLLAAPYFSSALIDAVQAGDTALPDLPPLPRALLYWDILDGEVSNGGVVQYFYNQSECLVDFERVPEFIAMHPVLKPHLNFAERIHAAWAELAPAVRQARESGDWPEQLFQRHAAQFESLQNEFFAVNHAIARALDRHLLQQPQDYFDIAPLPEVPVSGVAWVACRGQGYRGQLRFRNGFPVGPNVFERGKTGDCDVVWFTPDRQLLLVERSDWSCEGRNRDWIHYPSSASGQMRFQQGHLRSQNTGRSLWDTHGLQEHYAEDGRIESSTLRTDSEELLGEHYYTDGTLLLRREKRDDGEHRRRYWRNGQLNTHSIHNDADDAERYLGCWDEAGDALAPDGNGRLHEILGDSAWREGWLKNGHVHGEVTWYERGQMIGKQVYGEGEDQ